MKRLLLFFTLVLISCQTRIPQFNEEKAWGHLIAQTDLGYRVPGSPEIELCRKVIENHFVNLGIEVKRQNFTAEVRGKVIDGVNIIASSYPLLSRRIMLCAHYDTRPWADMDNSEENWTKPVLGANDAASGVAVLMELASVVASQQPSEYGIDFVFFDLEDSGDYGDNDTWCLGSKYFADNFTGSIPEKTILFDMIGDKDLEIPIEYFSYQNSPALVREVWEIARELDFSEFKNIVGKAIYDDHYNLLQKGFETINIIDFDYKYWHTVYDVPDNCSSRSLYIVGQTALNLIYRQ
ncbi:MAG: M28 family peptidase [Candidatus Cloacimonetes bacterium]|nr:M28 family peptidase [Candidatus Cloacimonadota bacterium]